VAFQLEDMLADLGCAVIGPASRVGQALDLLGQEWVDAGVLDLNVAGDPVTDALAAQNLPYIFATGYGASGLTARYAAGRSCKSPFLQNDLRKAMLDSLMEAS
jgi:hypothetical protein